MAKFKPLPPAESLKSALAYDPVAGSLTRIATGKSALVKTSNRYWAVYLDGKAYLAHRVIWRMVTGEGVDFIIDFENGNGLDCSWSNLRKATAAQDCWNKGKQSRNNSGYKGVFYEPDKNRYRAQITVNGKQRALGRYRTAAEAHLAYCIAAAREHKQFANFG